MADTKVTQFPLAAVKHLAQSARLGLELGLGNRHAFETAFPPDVPVEAPDLVEAIEGLLEHCRRETLFGYDWCSGCDGDHTPDGRWYHDPFCPIARAKAALDHARAQQRFGGR